MKIQTEVLKLNKEGVLKEYKISEKSLESACIMYIIV